MGCKILNACSGGVTHWALTFDDEADDAPPSPVISRSTGKRIVDNDGKDVKFKVMTVAWGQNANNCELGYGEG